MPDQPQPAHQVDEHDNGPIPADEAWALADELKQPAPVRTGTDLDQRPVEDHQLPPLHGDQHGQRDPMTAGAGPGDAMERRHPAGERSSVGSRAEAVEALRSRRTCRACGGEVERFGGEGPGGWWAHAHRGDEVARHNAVVDEPAASETPQDAGEVDRREMCCGHCGCRPGREGVRHDDVPCRVDSKCPASHEAAHLTVERDEAVTSRNAAASEALYWRGEAIDRGNERDAAVKRAEDAEAREARLRAGIEALMSAARVGAITERTRGDQYRERYWLDLCILAESLLATPDVDAQDEEVRRA